MARRTRIKWNLKAFEEIRRMDQVDRALEKVVNEIAEEAGEGYEANVAAGKTRSRGGVVTSNAAAWFDNAENNTLIRLLSRIRV